MYTKIQAKRSALTMQMLVACAVFSTAFVTVRAQMTPVVPANTEKTEESSRSEEIIQLSPFVVTEETENGYRAQQTLVGSRTSKNLMELPANISIITKEVMDDLNAVQVHDVLQFAVAGATQNQTINDDVNFRGFRTTFSLRNGITKTSYKRNPMYDVERVEVIRGPGAMLLGNNSFLGGAVNFVSMKASDKKKGDLQLSVAENDYARMAANVTGPLFKKNNISLDYRLTLGASTGKSDREIEHEDQKFIGIGLAAYFGSNSSLILNAYYFRDNGYYYWEDFLDYNTLAVPVGATGVEVKLNPLSTKSFSPARKKDAFWHNQDSFIDVAYQTRITDNTNLRLYYNNSNLVDRRRILRGITIAADNHTLNRQDIPLKIDNYRNELQVDLSHVLPITDSIKLESTLGADVSAEYQRQDQAVNGMPALDTANIDFTPDDAYLAQSLPGAGLPSSTQNVNRVNLLSYFFQENLSFFKDKLFLVGGLRWFAPGGTDKRMTTGVVTDRNDEVFATHKYGVLVKARSWLSVYWTDTQNAFPQTGFTDRYALNDQLGAPYDIQKGKLEEIGLKVDHQISKSLSIWGALTVFDMALTNVPTTGELPEGPIAPPPNPLNLHVSGRIQSEWDTSDGWELEYGLRWVTSNGRLNFLGTFSKTDARSAASKLEPNDTPPEKYSVLAKYTWTKGVLEGLSIGGAAFDQKEKRNTANSYIDVPRIINVFGSYSWGKHWSTQLNLNNLTDERYIVALAANGLVQTVPGMKSTLAFKYRW